MAKRRTPQVSSHGRYRNSLGVVRTPKRRRDGYRVVTIDGKKYLFHRLVATAFVRRDSAHLTQVHHLDHTPGNDVPANLMWVTHSQNVKFSLATGARARPMNEQDWLARHPVAEPAIDPALIESKSNVSARFDDICPPIKLT